MDRWNFPLNGWSLDSLSERCRNQFYKLLFPTDIPIHRSRLNFSRAFCHRNLRRSQGCFHSSWSCLRHWAAGSQMVFNHRWCWASVRYVQHWDTRCSGASRADTVLLLRYSLCLHLRKWSFHDFHFWFHMEISAVRHFARGKDSIDSPSAATLRPNLQYSRSFSTRSAGVRSPSSSVLSARPIA